jgi:hypothetical protein
MMSTTTLVKTFTPRSSETDFFGDSLLLEWTEPENRRARTRRISLTGTNLTSAPRRAHSNWRGRSSTIEQLTQTKVAVVGLGSATQTLEEGVAAITASEAGWPADLLRSSANDDSSQATAVALATSRQTARMLKVGSSVVALTCVLSLALALLGLVGVLTPFAALLLLVASPFFYWMGASAEQQIPSNGPLDS